MTIYSNMQNKIFFFVIRLWSNICYLSKVYARDIGLVYSNHHDPQKQISL